MAYTTLTNVQNRLGGVTLTGAALAEATRQLAVVQVDIDTYCGVPARWESGAIVDEPYTPAQRWLYLRRWPVASIEAVSYTSGLSTIGTALASGVGYLAHNLAGRTRIDLPSWRGYERVLVSYTPVATVPADVTDVATELVARRLQNVLAASTSGATTGADPSIIKSFSVGQDLSITYRDTANWTSSAGGSGLPADLAARLRHYRWPPGGIQSIPYQGVLA